MRTGTLDERMAAVRPVLKRMRRAAARAPSHGGGPPDLRSFWDTEALTEPGRPTRVGLTLDYGHHSSGWWANSDYEACYRLSISHPTGRPEMVAIPPMRSSKDEYVGGMPRGKFPGFAVEAPSIEEIRAWGRAAFGDEVRKAWVEPPASALDLYRFPGVAHIRLFVDREGNPIQPEGEVYHLKPWDDGTSPEKVYRQ